ncbi:MAG TPA: hypothetical protein DEA08_32540 [Planctomycetes bacterium]|nr:hypothetical protein [Planctomycetota bacterium]
MNQTRTRSLGLALAGSALFALGLGLGQRRAQADDAKLAKAKQLLAASGKGKLGDALVATLRQRIERELAQSPSPQGQKILVALREAKADEFDQELAQAYAKVLDAEALDAGLAFYATTGGKAFAAKRDELWAAEQALIEVHSRKLIYAALKRAGMNTPEENMKEARRNGNEAAAIGALRAISSAQALFREGDKDNDGTLQYAGDLAALGKTNLIDSVLASGKKNGYRFKVVRAKGDTGQFCWMATASPIEPGVTGERHFATNHSGVTWYRTDKPFEFDLDQCEVKGGTPLGR